MNSRSKKTQVLAVAAAATMVAAGVIAQDKPAAQKPPAEPYASRWDIFAGYSYLAPHGTVNVIQAGGTTEPFSYKAQDIGGIGSGAYYFNRYVGAQVEVGVHEMGSSGDSHYNDGFLTPSAGLIVRLPTSDITPFAHGLVGGAYVNGPDHEKNTWGTVLTVGGGMDYNTPLFDHHLAIRLFQADYQYMHVDFGPVEFGGRANINAARLSGGLVFHMGSIAPPPPVTLACSASPASVFPGEPVTVTATADMLNPKKKATYTFTGDGVKGTDATATVDTKDLAPGAHTVKCNVSEGPKAGQSADATAQFTVKEFEPPTISCSANPTTIKPGDSSTITATGLSPQNRQLTYSYSASSGSVSGTGTTATFSSAGAATGTATVTCTVTDDKGKTATATTPITIEAPYVPPPPTVSSLCSITFDKDKKRPARVDNEAKACLDQVALTLKSKSDATAAVVGSATTEEKTPAKGKRHAKKVEDLASQRAVNTKDYLVTEGGIDASRIVVYTGTGDGQKVEDYLIPSGATFNVEGATKVSDDVKAQPRKAMAPKHHAAHKKAAQ